ncbi:MAG TPA: hypothetical protein VHB69_00305 [Mycobacteriales bacterium]|nr:hypothetical protein [Mycobacteriales bacterium]
MSRLSGPDVVALWGGANGVLVAILLGYGESAFATALYASSAALIELIALSTWWVQRRHSAWAASSPGPRRSRPAALAGVVVALAGCAGVWDWWLALPALFPAGALVGELATEVRRARS